ncbi:M56 family metallopeptidase [Salmonirosea aquatica]|uniref:M48 family metalloprotease n=1 Tax=Salmonirosea aquatica TaxID=2654236 RepID=A0A7C9BKL9_9BACT|nr:M48 family metalloprotease [Cytophagaceae bacterium SJW1-29]
MKNLLDLIPSPQVSALGWTLLHSVWQAALLCTIAALGFYLLRSHSAQSRYTLGVTMLGTQILASVATYLYYLPATIEKTAVSALVPYTAGGTLAGLNSSVAPLPTLLRIQLWLAAHLNELVVCWFIGVGILLLRFAGGWFYLERLRFVSRPVKNAVWHTRFGVLVAKLNIGRSVELRETARIVTPMVVGVLQPVVLVPIGLMTGLSVKEVEAVLAHELAHIRRHDYFVNLVQSFVEVVYFFHPALWWLSDRIRTEREHCCDDLAMAVCDDRLSLAHALVRVAEFRHESSLVVAFAANKPLLLRRVRRVLGVAEPAGRRLSGYLPMAIVLLSLLVGASVYAFQKGDIKKKKEQTDKITKHNGDTEVSVVAPVKNATIADTVIEKEIAVMVEEPLEVPMDLEIEESIAIYSNDSTQKKMAEFHARMQEYQQQMQPYHKEIQALQQQLQPLHQRMAELQLKTEKEQFEVERFQREQEKIEWKKQNAQEARQKLMEKRSAVMYPKNGQAKPAPADMEKQLADIEAQIKAKEQEITSLNEQIAQSRKQMNEAEKPLNNLNAEMEKLNQETEVFDQKMEAISGKMEIIGRKMELEAQKINSLLPPPPPVERPAKVKGVGKVAPTPPPAARSPKAPAAVQGKVAPAPAAAPVPPKKK